MRKGKIAQVHFGPTLQSVQAAEDQHARAEISADGSSSGECNGKFSEIRLLNLKIQIGLLVGVKRVQHAAPIQQFWQRKRQENISAQRRLAVQVECQRLQLQIVGTDGRESCERSVRVCET